MRDEDVTTMLDGAALDVAAQVRERRLGSDRSQEALARRMNDLGCSSWRQTTVAKVEAGSRPVSLREAIALSYALGFPSVDQLLGQESGVPEALRANAVARVHSLVRTLGQRAADVVAQSDPGTAAAVSRVTQQIVELSEAYDGSNAEELRAQLDELVDRELGARDEVD